MTAWFVAHLVGTMRYRRIYLYRHGVIVVNWRGRIRFVAPWPDIQIYRWSTTRGCWYRCVQGGRRLIRYRGSYRFGPGRTMVDLAADELTPLLRGRLHAGESLAFGPVTMTASGLVHGDRTLAWSAVRHIPTSPYQSIGTFSVGPSLGRSIKAKVREVPNYATFVRLPDRACVNAAKRLDRPQPVMVRRRRSAPRLRVPAPRDPRARVRRG